MNARSDPADAGVAQRELPAGSLEDATFELSARRTGMSFQRTRLSADRTLMSVIRTSLSLIGFGFTIYQFFEKLHASELLVDATAPRRFGTALLSLGSLMLLLGIAYHALFMLQLRRLRRELQSTRLIHGESGFPVSMTLVTASLLLLVGVAAVTSTVFGQGPLQ